MHAWRSLFQPLTLVLRDTLILDRWRWLARRLPVPAGAARLLDVGCAAGGFSMGAARRGYDVLGVDYDERTLAKARGRAARFGIPNVRFEVCDARRLGERGDLKSAFDVVICCETIEHVMDDAGLMRALAGCLAPSGRLLLTTPYARFRAISRDDDAPPSVVEDGGHVRRGYVAEDFDRLCGAAGLEIVAVSHCGGWLSQKITGLYRLASRFGAGPAALLIMPLRPLPVLLDGVLARVSGWPPYGICLEARRPGTTA